METMGERIAKYRKLNNLTQESLAEKIGVDNKTISRWERDINEPSPYVLKKLSEVLNVRVNDLISDHEINQEIKKIEESKKKNTLKKVILVFIALVILVSSNLLVYKYTKEYYDLQYYEIIPYNKDVLVSGNLMRNKGMTTLFIDHINYSDKENPMGTAGAIKTNHVVIELLSNEKFMASEVIDRDEKEYLYNLLSDVRFYFSIREYAEEDFKDFDYKDMSIRISYGENKVIETDLVLKEIES